MRTLDFDFHHLLRGGSYIETAFILLEEYLYGDANNLLNEESSFRIIQQL